MTQAPPAPPKTPPKPPTAPPQFKNVQQAILLASENFGDFTKDSDNPYFKARYMSLNKLLSSVRSSLADVGCFITSAFAQDAQGRVVVRTMIQHVDSDTFISSDFPVADASNPQKVGSAGTYGMRYNLMHLLGIAPEDDDGNSIANPQRFMGPDPAGTERTAPLQQPAHDQAPPNWL